MRIYNKKAGFNYKLEDKFEAGISLTGGEAKSIREKHADLSNSVCRIIGREVYLINANIPVAGAKYEPTRTRKLLLHKDEILAIATRAKQRKLTLVPVALYNQGRIFKLEIALGKAKKKFEKRESIKKKDIERELETEFRAR
ncbi:SsrA-binding protein [Candidatus Woesebacteria bacterium CG07_land_8_20_14_0_80_44_9]|uniref:SsrA-binding protein n=2 Tax=Candidatus Woeseibacteriota TaxID=1752722 RepID=A0A2M6YFB6_9BACT|nr:MAG: SsrA-binding protein [Candidatus Woesebacteria bacterium CG07_land_8_20_14_0_80_44_9]PIZ45727.1 MAG: SsrA-binding protein [Candidatus Woesebacteria bacterium CG_4_10_14_0_2_um_filter_44_9]